MIKENKLGQLTKEIQSAVPSIMRLEMGCKIENEEGFFMLNGSNLIQIYKGTKHEVNYLRDEKLRMYKKQIMKDDILGRDITLEDCLIAIKKNAKYGKNLSSIYLLLDKHWQLNTPLQKQEDETINFLHSLICNDE